MTRSICELEEACEVSENGRWSCDDAMAWVNETEELLGTLDEAAGMVDCSVNRDEIKVWMVRLLHAFARLTVQKHRRDILPGIGSGDQQHDKLQSGDLCFSPFGQICIVIDNNSGFLDTVTLYGSKDCTVSRTVWAANSLEWVCSYDEFARLAELASELKRERTTEGKEGER